MQNGVNKVIRYFSVQIYSKQIGSKINILLFLTPQYNEKWLFFVWCSRC